ncbi:MAG: alkaline phosphatase, partial [Acutalibacteraceae bacterium]
WNINGRIDLKHTLIWGGADENITPENAAENGFTYVQSISDIEALASGERSFGQFNYGELKTVQNTEVTPTIETMTKSAIDILDDNENGFFLMVEGAQIDKYCHDKELDNAVVQLAELDKAVKAALDYAKEDGSTLVVVTADHETGGVTYSEIQGGYYCTIGSHTSSNVPLFVSDEAAGFENGAAYENRDISCQLALCLGMENGSFPACIPVLGKKEEV